MSNNEDKIFQTVNSASDDLEVLLNKVSMQAKEAFGLDADLNLAEDEVLVAFFRDRLALRIRTWTWRNTR